MRVTVLSISTAILLILPVPTQPGVSERTIPAEFSPFQVGTIIPQPTFPESFSEKPTEILFRIINRSQDNIFLQGIGQEGGDVQLFFYHRDHGKGWKPFFSSLPCDLPTCRNLHAFTDDCALPVPYVIPLGAAGTINAVREFRWGGLLYQRIEATREPRQRRYCYKGWVPTRGRMRIEIEFSKTRQEGRGSKGAIGGRSHTAIEFNLPARRQVYEVFVGK
jgi:hypothetical protein